MATSKKNEPVESKTAISEEPQQVETLQGETQQDTISDRKLILAPLAKYGAVAFVLASIIVTTAIVLNSEFNNIDNHVAAVEAEIAQQRSMEQLAEQEATGSIENSATTPETLANNDDEIAVDNTPDIVISTTAPILPESVTMPVVTESVTTAPVMPAPVFIASQETFKTFDPKARIAEHHEYMAKQDQKYLESFKHHQEKQIEMLRKQLAQQQERIDAIEKRNMETYEMREAAIKRLQEAREQTLNRI